MTHSTFRPNRSAAALTVFGLGTAALGPAAQAQIEFHPPRIFDGTYWPNALADLNGNGHLDAALGGPDGVHIYFNAGDGTLVHEVTLLPGATIGDVVAGDLDGNGIIDLVIVEHIDWRQWHIHFFHNRGDGRAWDMHTLDVRQGSSAQPIVLADLTGNGRLEVVYGSSVDFGDRSPEVRAVVLRGPGRYDDRLLYRHNLTWGHVRSLAVGDLDDDGSLDVAALFGYSMGGPEYSDLAVLFNEGAAPWRQSVFPNVHRNWMNVDHPLGLAVGDLDGDGDLDIIVGASNYDYVYKVHESCQIGLLVNEGGGVFRRGPVFDVGRLLGARSVQLADLDSDGRLDIVTATNHEGADLHVLRNAGGLEFEPPLDIPLDARLAQRLGVGDFDGDGQLDVLVPIRVSDRPSVSRVLQFLNATVIGNPRLHAGALRRRQTAEFVVTDAEPGEAVHFLYSLTGQGNSRGVGVLGGITLDLLDPIVHFGSATANANGEAMLTVIVPPNAPLRPVTFQSVIRRGPGGVDSVKTPFQVGVIEE